MYGTAFADRRNNVALPVRTIIENSRAIENPPARAVTGLLPLFNAAAVLLHAPSTTAPAALIGPRVVTSNPGPKQEQPNALAVRSARTIASAKSE